MSEEVKVQQSKEKTNKADKKMPFFKGVKGELKKIIWPTKDALTKQSIAVVVISFVLGVIITLLDTAIQYGIDLLVK